jgi:23S rRNA (adenine2030-N6)-methyltransferase
MLSYRHAFHAGNHADCLKHFVYAQILDYFNQKEKPYWVVDTHAGAGMYALETGFATQNAEWKNGIFKTVKSVNLTPELKQFIDLIQSFNQNKTRLQFYPGSPAIAQHFLRERDKLRLFELHPADCKLLLQQFSTFGRQVKIEQQDGFSSIKACLPPPTKRGLVLIDPPYELKDDYQKVVNCIKDSLVRFAIGTYIIWYPLLQRPEPLQMVEKLKKLNENNWLDVTLSIEQPSQDGFGMFGSGLLIINPPYTLPKTLEQNLPVLRDILALDVTANFTLAHQIS